MLKLDDRNLEQRMSWKYLGVHNDKFIEAWYEAWYWPKAKTTIYELVPGSLKEHPLEMWTALQDKEKYRR